MSDRARDERVFDTAYAVSFALEMHARIGPGKEHADRSPALLVACGHEAATVGRAAVSMHRKLDRGAAFDGEEGE
jgi:hypothetical protein